MKTGERKMKKILLTGLTVFALIAMSGFVSAETIVNIDMDIESGFIDINADSDLGTDEEARSHFIGIGGFAGNYNANTDQTDELMDSLISVSTKGTAPRSRFEFESTHNLGSRNHNTHKMVFSSWVEGTDATMDMYLDNSPYQSQAERVSGSPMLTASDVSSFGMGFTLANSERDDSYTNALSDISLIGMGSGSLGKTKWGSNHLARGIGYNQNAIDIRSGEVKATGSGTFSQYAFGDNSLEMNGFIFGSGNGLFTAHYGDSFEGNFVVKAK